MIGFTVVLAKVTTWPTTPITDWSICTIPSNAPAAVSFPANMPPCPNSISRKPDSALATPPSTNSPLMKLPTLDSAPVNLSKMASPCSPNTPPTISRIYSRLSPSRLTTAIMLDTTPTTGSAPDSRVPKPPAIGPQMLPISFPLLFSSPPPLPSMFLIAAPPLSVEPNTASLNDIRPVRPISPFPFPPPREPNSVFAPAPKLPKNLAPAVLCPFIPAKTEDAYFPGPLFITAFFSHPVAVSPLCAALETVSKTLLFADAAVFFLPLKRPPQFWSTAPTPIVRLPAIC